MKKYIFIFMMMLCVVGCGSPATSGADIGGNSALQSSEASVTKEEQNNKESLQFDCEFERFGHKFGYSSELEYDNNSAGGVTINKGNEYWISVDSPDYYGLIIPVENLDGLVEKCKEGVCKTLEDRYIGIFNIDKTVQYVTEETEVSGKNVNALKVKGSFENTFSGEKVQYVALYFLLEVGDTSYPFYMIGIVREGTLEDMEAYMDASLDYICPVD